ncbi:MAG: hypothetical protein AAF843_06010 [Bacteroidota bacterium]
MKKSLYLISFISSIFFTCSTDSDPQVNCGTLTLSLDIEEIVMPSACNALDGSIQVAAIGFTGGLSYRINNGAPNSNGSFSNLGVGEYTVTAEDQNGCSLDRMITLSDPTIGFSITDITSTFSGCETNNATLEVVTAGNNDLEYSIDGLNFQQGGIFENVNAGTYNVVVRENGCSESQEHFVLSGVSFSNEIEAIISSNCAVSGCHVANTGRVNFNVLSNIQNKAQQIKSRTQSGSMPPGNRSITQTQIDLIACWVDDGALDN